MSLSAVTDPTAPDPSAARVAGLTDAVHVWLLTRAGRLVLRRTTDADGRWGATAATPLHGATPAAERIATALGIEIDPRRVVTVGTVPLRLADRGRPEFARLFLLRSVRDPDQIAVAPGDELAAVDPAALVGWLTGQDVPSVVWSDAGIAPQRLPAATAPDWPFMYWAHLHGALAGVA